MKSIAVALCLTLPCLAQSPAQTGTVPEHPTTAAAPASPAASAPVDMATTLPEGTQIKLRLNQTISSADEKVGDLVGFSVVDDIDVGGKHFIPHGTEAQGHITKAEPKKWAGRGGKLDVMIDYLRAPDGRKIQLSSEKRSKAGGHVGVMTGAMVGTAILFFPAAPFLLMIHGKEMVIPQGTVVTAFTANNTLVMRDASH